MTEIVGASDFDDDETSKREIAEKFARSVLKDPDRSRDVNDVALLASEFLELLNGDDIKIASMIKNAIDTLRMGVDQTTAKNYIAMSFAWDEGMMANLPFDRVEVAFIRRGALTPHAARAIAEEQLRQAREELREAKAGRGHG